MAGLVPGGLGGADQLAGLGAGVPTYQREIYQYCYGTATVTYADGDYAEMKRMLELLRLQVETRRYP